MAAFNWIVVDGVCPACATPARLRCQTHHASSFDGDEGGRFANRTYRLGDQMRWWPREDPAWLTWRADHGVVTHDGDREDEACYSDCLHCLADLCVVVRFRGLVVESVLGAWRDADWPPGYSR